MRFFKYFRPVLSTTESLLSIIGSIVTTGASISANFIMPYVLGALTDALMAGSTEVSIMGTVVSPTAAVIILGSSFIASYDLPLARSMATSRLAPRIKGELQTRLNEHEIAQSSAHHDSKSSGYYANLSMILDRSIPILTNDFLNHFFPTTLELIFATGIMCSYDWQAGLTFGGDIVAFILFATGTKFIVIRATDLYQTASVHSENANRNVLEKHAAIHVTKTAPYFLANAKAANERTSEAEGDYNIRSYALQLGQNFIIGVGFTVVCLFAVNSVEEGLLEPKEIVTLTAYLINTVSPLSLLGSATIDMIKAISEIGVYLNALEEDDPILNPHPGVPLRFENGTDIKFDHVSFRHRGNSSLAIDDVSFDIPAGSNVLIVGQSGSGKTTLFRLLYRDFAPLSGKILIGGHDIMEFDIHSYRQYLSCVTQELQFNNDTFFKIVASGAGARCNAVSEAEVTRALETAQLLEHVKSLPKGVNTLVGENASTLSGGQKQRLAIARALVDNSGIVTFDESTSALDPKTAQSVQSAIYRLHGAPVVMDS